MLFFHNTLVIVSIFIGSTVLFMLCAVIFFYDGTKKSKSIQFTHSSKLEAYWTFVPAYILYILAFPSFSLLYSLDDIINKPDLTLKIVGHQWYWSYEYSSLFIQEVENFSLKTGCFNFDSYLLNFEDLTFGTFRLLEVDRKVLLPTNTHIRLLITSADVLHSWAVPSFGIKVDACPGRLSQASLFIKRDGLFYGQCSEICGINHGFMPIVVKSMDNFSFLSWLLLKGIR
jgi:cytochrome c oxidase subunit 2